MEKETKTSMFTYRTESGMESTYIILEKDTRKHLQNIVIQTNAFLLEPLTEKKAQFLIESIVDFYFVHSDDEVEFKNFIEYISLFMELLANNIEKGDLYGN